MQYGQILLRAFNQNNKKGFKNGKGKFRKTKQNVDELAKVVKSTIVNATSYQRVGTLTKVVGVVRNQGKNACTAETISALVPDRLVTASTSKEDVMQITLNGVFGEIKKGTEGYLEFLLNVLKHIVQEYRKNLIVNSDSDSDSDSEEEMEDNDVGDFIVEIVDSDDD